MSPILWLKILQIALFLISKRFSLSFNEKPQYQPFLEEATLITNYL